MPGPSPARRVGAAITLVAAVLAVFPAPRAGAADGRGPVRRVLVVSLPGTTWAALSRAVTPNLDSLLAQAAVGSTSVRGIGRETRPGDGYVTIGAGTAAAGVRRVEARADIVPGGMVSRAVPELTRDAKRRHRGAEIGALGDALSEADVARAVIGTAGPSEAILALMDGGGFVPGVVGPPAAAAQAFEEIWNGHGRAVVLFEASDLARLHASARQAGGAIDPAVLDRTLAATDELLGLLLRDVDLDRDAVTITATEST